MDSIEQLMRERFEHVKAMHTIINNMNHEDAYMEWVYLVPDCPSEDDLRDIAEDDGLFQDACNLFRELMKLYAGDGFCIGTKAW